MRKLLFIVFSLAPLFSFGECRVVYNYDDGQVAYWYLQCDTITTNITVVDGVPCTNCTAMSPAKCQELKVEIASELTRALSKLSIDEADFSFVSDLNDELQSYAQMTIQVLNDVWRGYSVDSDYGFIYRLGQQGVSSELISEMNEVFDFMLNELITAFSGFNDIPQQVDSAAHDYNRYVQAELDGIKGDLTSLKSYVNTIDCSACSGVSAPAPTPSEPSTPSDGCPCRETILLIRDLLEETNSKLEKIRLILVDCKNYLKRISDNLDLIHVDVTRIRSTTDRIDDYFNDDAEFNFKQLIQHTLSLSNAVFSSTVSLPPNLYWQDYTNATQFKDSSGSPISWLLKGELISTPTDGYSFDIGEYQSLNWFQRMEFLLGSVVGLFSKTNSPSSDFSSDQKSEISGVQSTIDGLSGSDQKSIIESMISSVKSCATAFNPFSGVFSGHSARKITLLSEVSLKSDDTILPNNAFPTVEIDLDYTGDGQYSINSLVELCHNITTFLCFVLFLLLDVFFIWKFVQYLIAIHRWYWKVYRSWVATMFNGAR